MTGKQSSGPMAEDKLISKRDPKLDFSISSYERL